MQPYKETGFLRYVKLERNYFSGFKATSTGFSVMGRALCKILLFPRVVRVLHQNHGLIPQLSVELEPFCCLMVILEPINHVNII